ncbi:transposase [Streptomyces sp. NPDC004296]|uniref:transposase n=1 Tax=Streptomyces sp. NPDC004296 TaxID=3364697 RepID=UPI0036752872
MPVLARFPDGSYLSTLGDLRVRVIDCEITVTTSARKPTSLYRLATTLLDHQHHPAAELTTLYHQRWEIETAYLELKSTILGGRVLRARTPEGIDQEIYALVVVYQLLRTAMADATSTQPGTDPDRLLHRLADRPRPDHPGRGHHRRHRHRPGRHHRPARPGRPPAPAAATRQPPHRQTRHLQVPGPRPPYRPHRLQSHHRHRSLHPRRPLTTCPNHKLNGLAASPAVPAGPEGTARKDGTPGRDGAPGRDGQTCPTGYRLQAPTGDPDALVCRRDGAPASPDPGPSTSQPAALAPDRRRTY